MLSVTLYTVFAMTILTLSLFSPTVSITPVSSAILPAKKALLLVNILSGYATINKGSDHILAVSKPAMEWGTDGLMNRIYSSLGRIPVIGNTRNISDPEQILYLQPDIVFASDWQAGFLNVLGLPGLLQVKPDPRNPTQFRIKTWKMMGEATGKSARATILLNRYATKLAELQAQIALITHHKRVVYVHSVNGSWFIPNSSYYLAYKLELVGAINGGKGFKVNGAANLEQLLLMDPDVVLFVTIPGDRTTMKEILGRPEFQALRAVREHRIYKLPVRTYMNEPVEDPLLLRWMAEVLYPEVMPCKLRDEYKETYQEVYHYSISDDEIDKAIYLEENRLSSGYNRFVRQKN